MWGEGEAGEAIIRGDRLQLLEEPSTALRADGGVCGCAGADEPCWGGGMSRADENINSAEAEEVR